MDFFQAQARAHRRTKLLVLLFGAGVAATIAVMYVAIALLLTYLGGWSSENFDPYSAEATSAWAGTPIPWDPTLLAVVAGGTLLLIGGAALVKSGQLSRGGPAIAEMVGGRAVDPQTTDLNERRLVNVVEEMAIASGVPVPTVYILDDEAGLNAFAAGLTTSDAVVAVTRGTLEKLNRDELQGVVAHEFSHILNGDMRTNVRLVAVLFGIFVLTILGRGLLRSLRHMRGGKKSDGRIVAVMFAVGLVLLIIGYISYFFGRLIQAAVSRQREFLADASAVQFTRNPAGIGGALKKIGSYALGGRVRGEKATAIGHFFFAEGSSSNLFGLLATHPPLAQRIREIDPSFDGEFREAKEVVDVTKQSFVQAGLVSPRPVPPPIAFTPESTVASVGTLAPEHIANAHALIEEIPLRLRHAAQNPREACALIYGLLLADADNDVRSAQLALLSTGTATGVDRFLELLRTLKPEHKLPLGQLAMPALRELPPESHAEFFATIKRLVEADGRISTLEFALQKLVHRHLALSRRPALSPGSQVYSFQAMRGPTLVVLSAISYAAADNFDAAKRSFAEGSRHLRNLEGSLELLPPTACTYKEVDTALDQLARAAGPIKQRILLACAHIVSTDGTLRVAESELLRAFAAMLDCPMPPLLTSAR